MPSIFNFQWNIREHPLTTSVFETVGYDSFPFPPIPTQDLITESNDNIITESGNFITTE